MNLSLIIGFVVLMFQPILAVINTIVLFYHPSLLAFTSLLVFTASFLYMLKKNEPEPRFRMVVYLTLVLDGMLLVSSFYQNQPQIMVMVGLHILVNSLGYFWVLRFKAPLEELKRQINQSFPSVELKNAEGKLVTISDSLKRPAVFVFFRGNYCQFCASQIKNFAEHIKEFEKRNVSVYLVSIQNTLETRAAQQSFPELTFFSDESGELADVLHLRHRFGSGLIRSMKGKEPDSNFPGYVITNSFGKIEYFAVEKFYTRREPIAAILNKVDQVLEKDHLNLEVHRQNQQLLENNSELKQLFEEKTNLIRLVTHDLNNSLSIILGSSKMAIKLAPDQDKKNKKYWQKTYNAANIQSEILNQVRNLEALASGKLELKLEPVNFDEVVEKALFLFKEKINEKNLELVINNEAGSHKFLAEPVSFSTSVFNNLISNAIKFSHSEGKIEVTLEKKNDHYLELKVQDHGIGMPEELKQNIFRSDKPTSRPGTSGEKGTGFGMPLVKSFVEQYQGSISLESIEKDSDPRHCGTTFILKLKKA